MSSNKFAPTVKTVKFVAGIEPRIRLGGYVDSALNSVMAKTYTSYRHLADTVRELLKRQGMQKQVLAEKIGKHPSIISQMLTSPSPKFEKSLVRAVEILRGKDLQKQLPWREVEPEPETPVKKRGKK
jgi:lambda repressor-like predicted transcriptional regulator